MLTLQQARSSLRDVQKARKNLPEGAPKKLRASMKKTEELGRKLVAAKIALAQRPDSRRFPVCVRSRSARQQVDFLHTLHCGTGV